MIFLFWALHLLCVYEDYYSFTLSKIPDLLCRYLCNVYRMSSITDA